ncbi:MAG TPA: TonB-dependent receptor [Vicinamibacterales bacterium]|nr:TonB-dependent receptor [Vicinamibacterales bacterium]
MWWIAVLFVAQIAGAQVTGVVHDQAGAAVPGATVTVTDVATNRQRVVVSSADGVYAAAGLAPGDYRIEVDLAGFKPMRRDGVRLATGETARLDFDLAVGSVQEAITVTADAPMLRSESSTLRSVVEHRTVVQLPLNGRTFVGLSALAPGVALPPNSQLPRINGGRPRTNEYLFDGISVLQPEPGQVAYFPVVDAIQEFAIESNSPPAEFGRFNGGVVNLTTKAGTNSLHGDAFEFLRNEALNARNYFQSALPDKPDYRRSQFGGVAGGPIARDRTFFFADYQGQRQSIARTVTSTVPTLLERQGIFPDRTIAASQMDPVAVSLLSHYPLPTTAASANNYTRTANEIDDQDQWDARIDHKIATNRDQLFGRLTYFRDGFVPVTPLPDGSGMTTGTLGPQNTTAWAFASNYQHTFASSILNELRVGNTTRSVVRSAATTPSTLPTYVISGFQQIGAPPNTASTFNTGVTELADSVSWVTGRHAVKAGLDWRWERLNVVQPPSPNGIYTFNDIGGGTPFASFLLGDVQSFSIDVQHAPIQERAHVQEYFVQDDWQVSNRFTLNPGLRYTLNFPSTEINGQTAVFNLQTQLLEYPGANPVRPLKKDNFGPRFGGAYQLSDSTVVSAGYGLIWIEMAGITTPFTTPTFPFLQTVTQRALDNASPAFQLAAGPTVVPLAPTPTAGLGQGVFSVDPTLGSGYAQQWNVSVQRQLTANTTFEAAYVGSFITHVGIPDTNLNQLTVDQLALGPALLQKVPNPYYGIVPRSSSLGDPMLTVAQLMKPYPDYTTVSLYRNNVGTTRYAGLELSVRQRLSHRLQYSVAYTRSTLVDDASSVFDASILTGPIANYPVADSFNRALERDHSTGDIPNDFASSLVWDWKGWTVSMFATLQSGTPVAVTQTTNFNAFAGFGVQRPNLVGDPTLPADQRTPAHWFNTAAFAIAPQFTIGSASRNPVRGPSYRDVDLAVMRRVPIGGQAIELRAEVFNLLNTPNFGAPNAVAGAANFGTITTALDPRVIQVATKWIF